VVLWRDVTGRIVKELEVTQGRLCDESATECKLDAEKVLGSARQTIAGCFLSLWGASS
jgi:hypothetical protein